METLEEYLAAEQKRERTAWYKTEKGRTYHREYQRKWRAEHPEMNDAQKRRRLVALHMQWQDPGCYAMFRAQARNRDREKIDAHRVRPFRPRATKIPDNLPFGVNPCDIRSQFLYDNCTPSQTAYVRELSMERGWRPR